MKKLLTFFLLLSLSQISLAQDRPSFIRGMEITSGANLAWWNYNEFNTTQFSLPLSFSKDLDAYVKGLSADIVTTPVIGKTNKDNIGPNDGVLGVAGTKLRASYNWENLVIATFGIQLPTSGALDQKQNTTLSGMGTRQFALPVQQLVTGFNYNLTAATSYELDDDIVVGLGLSALIKSEYEPVEATKFNPGDEYTLLLGSEYTLYAMDKKFLFGGNLSYTFYTADELGGQEFEPGNNLVISVSAETKLSKKIRNQAVIHYNLKQNSNSYLGGPNKAEIEEGDQFGITNYMHYIQRKKFKPYSLWKITRYNDTKRFGQDVGGAWMFGVGGGGEHRLNNHMYVNAESALHYGRLNSKSVFGFEIKGGMQYIF